MSDFILGVVLGTIVGWLTDWLLFRRQMQGEADALRVELQAAQAQAKDLERKLEARDAEIHGLRGRLVSAQESTTRFEGMQSQFDSAQGELTALRGQLAEAELTAARVDELQMQLAAAEGEVESLHARVIAANEEVLGFNEVQMRLTGAESEAATLREQLASAQIEATRDAEARLQLENAQVEIADLRAQLEACMEARSDVGTPEIEMPSRAISFDSFAEPPAATTTEDAYSSVEPDDLRKIEGIGPKISRVLNDAGVWTFAELAATSVAQLHDILNEAGISRVNDPATWPDQAALAARGDWAALAALQNALKGGRRLE